MRITSAAWGDYDDDGDLDVLITGSADSISGLSKIYRNDGNNNFTDISTGLIGVFRGAVAWGDYDNDGDLDILLTGTTNGTSGISAVYRNDGGVFTDISAGLSGVFHSAVAWGDYDNDGDPDILLTGTADNATGTSKIYRNDGNDTFTEISTPLTGVFRSSVAWGDYDNDGDLDILLSGAEDSSNRVSKIYRNDGGSFVDIDAALEAVSRSSVAWGDYDSDGDLDIALSGVGSLLNRVSKIYRNDGGTFVDIAAGLTDVSDGSLAWGDYDNDGDLDIILTGRENLLSAVSRIYNNDSGNFTDVNAQLPGVFESSAAWGDFDNDRDLDILLTGTILQILPAPPPARLPFSNVYRNTLNVANTVPGAPAGLQATVVSGGVNFSWGKATDNETPQNGLNYNLRAGTTPGGGEIVSPMADAATGFRKVAALGNSQHDTSWSVNSLPAGTYFWSVQAIDNGFAGSLFAPEQSFTISENQPPLVANPLPDTTLEAGGPSFQRDLNAPPAVFFDPDGDPLSYSAVSSNPAVASAAINGSLLTVNPLLAGNAQVIVTADDGNGGAVSDTFLVTVTPGGVNQPPLVANPLPDTTLQAGGASFQRDLNAPPAVFLDPDGDPLSYSAISTNPAVASAAINGSLLTVTPLLAGSAQVIVTADDGNGGSVSDTFLVTVTPGGVNQPPLVANPLPDTTLQAGGASFQRDLNAPPAVFFDPDGDPLTYSAVSSNPAVASASVTGSILTVDPLLAGNAQVIVTADDGNGGTVSDTLLVTVTPGGVNQPPIVANPLPDTTLEAGGPSFQRDLNAPPAVFLDPDGDPLSYSAISTNPSVASAVIDGSLLTVDPLLAGNVQVIVTADDGNGGSVSDTFLVTVTPGGVNQPPLVANPLPDTTLQAGGASFQRDLNAPPAVFFDPDGDPLTYSAASSNPAVASVAINGSLLTVNPLLAGNVQVIVTADDGNGGAVSDTFLVTVTPGGVNQPPIVANPLPDTTLEAGGPSFQRDLNAPPAVFFDPDGDPLTYSAASSNPAVASASINGSLLTVNPLVVGSAQVIVTADDGNGGTVSDTLLVTVTPGGVNQPPIVANPLPDTTLEAGGPSFQRDLNAPPAVFFDPDGDPLTYSAVSSNPAVASASVTGSILTVNPLLAGNVQVIVTADDGNGGSVSDTLLVTVTPGGVNQPPLVANPLPDTTLEAGGPSFQRDLNAPPAVFFDPDGDPLTYSAASSNPAVASAVIDGSLLTVNPLVAGNAQVIVTADDGNGGAVSDTFLVTVTPGGVNQPPIVANPLPDTTLEAGGLSFQRDLNAPPAVFFDPDGDPLTYSAVSSNPAVASVAINGSLLTVNPLLAGNAQVTVTADDGNGGAVSDTFLVTVTPGGVNQPPIVANPLPDTTLEAGGPSFQRDLNAPPAVFFDPDGDPLTYSAASSNPAVASAAINGSLLTVNPLVVGNAQVIVTADDGNGGSVSDTFLVTVTPGGVNQPPIVANPLPDSTLEAGAPPFQRDLNAPPAVFLDPDGDLLTYSAVSLNPEVASVTINESVLTVAPLSAGNAGVIVSANDGRGGAVSDTFLVTVTQGGVNQPPIVANPIPDTTLQIGGASFQRNLNAPPAVFFDPDGDLLSYSAVSADPLIVKASIVGSILTVTSISVGSTGVSVTANDGKGGLVTDTFVVTVNTTGGNQAPIVANSIPDTTLKARGIPFVRNLEVFPRVFIDPEGGALTYTASTTIAHVATPTILGAVLTVTPIDPGIAEILVTASDEFGASATDTFIVTVTPGGSNQPPIVINSIPDTTLIANGFPFMANLDTVFFDPNGDPLNYSASSGNPSVAQALVEASILTVLPLDLGNTLITVSADDGRGGSASLSFAITIESVNFPPALSHDPVSLWDVNTAIPLSARASDDLGIKTVSIHYRQGGQGVFTEIIMTGTGDEYQAAIPATGATSRGLEYYIRAEDIAGLETTQPSSGIFSVRIRIPDPGIVRTNAQPNGSNQAAYRLFSLPLDADRKNPADVLEDDLGSYDNTRWRLFELRADQKYYEYPNTAEMAPGKAFWLIVRGSGIFLDSGAGVTSSTSAEYEITLHPGWNFIGNPFNFNIPLSNLQFQASQQSPALRFYNGAWNDPFAAAVTEIKPFEGYAVLNSSSSEEILLINPDVPSSPGPLLKLAAGNGPENFSWAIRILAQCQEARDEDNIAGAADAANSNWDELDYPEPPVIGEFVSVYFPHPEWEKITASYCTDIRPNIGEGEIWDFAVRSNIHDKIQLTFEGIEDVPAEYEIWLLDKAARITRNLRENNTYFVAGSGENSPKNLSLVVGRPGFVNGELQDIQTAPLGFELSQNFPNPFNPATTIRYGLPQEETVTLRIFDMLGQEVAVLVNREKMTSGYHAVIWDGRDRSGAAAASGVYVYQLQAGKASIFKKMILLK